MDTTTAVAKIIPVLDSRLDRVFVRARDAIVSTDNLASRIEEDSKDEDIEKNSREADATDLLKDIQESVQPRRIAPKDINLQISVDNILEPYGRSIRPRKLTMKGLECVQSMAAAPRRRSYNTRDPSSKVLQEERQWAPQVGIADAAAQEGGARREARQVAQHSGELPSEDLFAPNHVHNQIPIARRRAAKAALENALMEQSAEWREA